MSNPFEEILSSIADLKKTVEIQNETIQKLSVAKPIDGNMTREQVAEHFNCDIKTIDRLVNKGSLQMYGLPGCALRYFKKSEIENSLIKINKLKNAA